MWPYPWTHVGTPSHLGHMDLVAATMPSQAHLGAAQEAPDIGQWEGQDVPLVRPSSCIVKGGIPSSRRYLPTYLISHLESDLENRTPQRKQISESSSFQRQNNKKTFCIVCVYACHDAVSCPPPCKCQCLREVIHCSHVSSWECGHARGCCCACQAPYTLLWSFYVDRSTTYLLSIFDPPSLCL